MPRLFKKLLTGTVVGLLMLQLTATTAAAFYYADCSLDYPNDSPTWHAYRLGGRSYFAAVGQVVMRGLHGCTGYGPNAHSLSVAFPANLQDSDCLPFVQVGYGDSNSDGVLEFIAVQADNVCGVISPMSIGMSPVVGHLGKFEITKPTSTTWRARATDVTTGGTGYRTLTSHGAYTSEVWYGIETHDKFDQFGGAGSSNILRLQYMAYKFVGGPTAYTYLTGTGQVAWANLTPSPPACWVESVTTITTDQYTSLNGYTSGCP